MRNFDGNYRKRCKDITDSSWISDCSMTKRKKDNVIIILHVNEHGDLV